MGIESLDVDILFDLLSNDIQAIRPELFVANVDAKARRQVRRRCFASAGEELHVIIDEFIPAFLIDRV